MKTCTRCRESKPLSDFYNDKQKSDGKSSYCKTCRNRMTKGYEESNPEQRKITRVASKFGLSQDKAKELLNVKMCEICGSSAKLQVDHCHEYKDVRGVICRDCNIALGLFKDNPNLLEKAAKYLRDRDYY